VSSDPFDIPKLAEIFEALRRGRHICAEDGDLFWALRDRFDHIQTLFSHLGFRLEAHPRDFYYFHGSASLSDRSERMAVFMFILVEWLSDRGEQVEEAIITRKFNIDELPHMRIERYRQYMNEAGVAGEGGISDVIRNFERFGFARREGGSMFSFRSPVFRFVDLCHAVLELDDAGDVIVPDDTSAEDKSSDEMPPGGTGEQES